MKQHITIEQLNELSHANKEKLLGWLVSKNYAFLEDDNNWTFTTPTIGQMIEFLDEYGYDWCWDAFQDNGYPDDSNIERMDGVELCDALWQSVKEVLER